MVHEFLGDAANVDAGAANAPCGAAGRGLDIIAQDDARTMLRRLLCARHAATTASNYSKVVIAAVRALGFGGG